MTNKKRDTGCPIAYALDIFGDRWSLLIIRDLLFKGLRTYSEFLKSDEGIATNILASRLKNFEESGIIAKKRDPDNQRKLIYNITEKGAELAPILIEMMRWSARYDSNTRSDVLLEKIDKDPRKNSRGFIDTIKRNASGEPLQTAPDQQHD